MFDFGARLQHIRKKRSLSQKELALKINKSKSAISSYETNAQVPPVNVLISLAETLNVSLDYLVGFESGPCYNVGMLSDTQKEIIDLLFADFCSSTNSDTLSSDQIIIIQKLISEFTTNR